MTIIIIFRVCWRLYDRCRFLSAFRARYILRKCGRIQAEYRGSTHIKNRPSTDSPASSSIAPDGLRLRPLADRIRGFIKERKLLEEISDLPTWTKGALNHFKALTHSPIRTTSNQFFNPTGLLQRHKYEDPQGEDRNYNEEVIWRNCTSFRPYSHDLIG